MPPPGEGLAVGQSLISSNSGELARAFGMLVASFPDELTEATQEAGEAILVEARTRASGSISRQAGIVAAVLRVTEEEDGVSFGAPASTPVGHHRGTYGRVSGAAEFGGKARQWAPRRAGGYFLTPAVEASRKLDDEIMGGIDRAVVSAGRKAGVIVI